MYDVISFGSATQDVFLSLDDFEIITNPSFATGQGLCVPLGSKVSVSKMVTASGGGGTNAAVTFARQGFRTGCVGVIGKDANGTAILDELRREGIDAKYFQAHDEDLSAYSVILVSDDGERTILSYKGEGSRWQVDKLPWERLDASWFYVNSLGGHVDVLEHIVRHAKDKGAHLATNPGSKELALGMETLAPLWKSFDIVGMNQEEAAMLTGISYEREQELFKTMDELIGGIFIMTKGNHGVAVSDGYHLYTAEIPNNTVVERTGAGDAFNSGFTAEFIRSGTIEKAIQAGTANATSVVMFYGAKEGILRKGDPGQWPLVKISKRAL